MHSRGSLNLENLWHLTRLRLGGRTDSGPRVRLPIEKHIFYLKTPRKATYLYLISSGTWYPCQHACQSNVILPTFHIPIFSSVLQLVWHSYDQQWENSFPNSKIKWPSSVDSRRTLIQPKMLTILVSDQIPSPSSGTQHENKGIALN